MGRERFKCIVHNAKCRVDSRPSYFRGCDLNRRIPPCQGGSPGAIPGSRTKSNKSRTSLCSRVSKTQPAWGSTRAACHLTTHWGRGRKVMHLPCKQAQAGALPAVLHHFTAGNSTKAQREAS